MFRCPHLSYGQVWAQVVATVRQVVSQVGAGRVRGLGFTGTCSLVLVADTQVQLCGGEQEQGWDVIMWMDHRAQVPPRWSVLSKHHT